MKVNGKTDLSALAITNEVATEAAQTVLQNARGGRVSADGMQTEAQIYTKLSRETRGVDDQKSAYYAHLALGASQVEAILRKAILDGSAARFMGDIKPGARDELSDLF